jgi:hypothetical protein
MQKHILSIAVITALLSSSGVASDIKTQLQQLKNQLRKQNELIKELENKLNNNSQKIVKVEKKAIEAKKLAGSDNLKWGVDFRTAVDKINYEHVSGKKSKNNSLLTNRLWLNMAYAPSENISFHGTLSFLKAFGDTANHSQSNTNPGYANFDWVGNENALDDTVHVKEAFWLYKNNSFMGNKNISWTASFGRRPSTDGLGANFREDQPAKSALAHTVNVEFDGASFRWNLDKVIPLEGSWFKICMGRGLTNAKRRFQNDGTDYAKDETIHTNNDMAGFIFVPYDNGQYSIHTSFAKAYNMIGFTNTELAKANPVSPTYGQPLVFQDVGDLDLGTVMFKAEGIGDGISDFLDDTIFFASYAWSKTHPTASASEGGMLGSADSKTGHSTWIGLNMPDLISDGRFGIEWNKGSKYWRSMTYGEDTMAGSKIATRGTAWEVYYHKPLTKALTFSIRYTDIEYDYTGSQAFFGADGTPRDIATLNTAMYGNLVKETKDIRTYIRYRF